MPDMIIIAGPNGAGKTTFGNELRTKLQIELTYINADEIEARLRKAQRDGIGSLAAGREALAMIDRAVSEGTNVMLETTLASRTYAARIPGWQVSGYKVALVYIRLPSARHAIERVRRRATAGGHDIPVPAIERRYARSLEYFDTLYKPIVDEWYVWESRDDGVFVPTTSWEQT